MQGHPRWPAMVESSDKMCCIGERNANQFSILDLQTPLKTMKRQKDMSLKDRLPHPLLVVVQYATEEEQRNSSRRKSLSQSGNDAQLWMCLVVKAKFDAVKNSIA